MGWAAGSELADAVWNTIKKDIRESRRKKIAQKLIEAFQDQDCDMLEETRLWDIAELPRDEDKGDDE